MERKKTSIQIGLQIEINEMFSNIYRYYLQDSIVDQDKVIEHTGKYISYKVYGKGGFTKSDEYKTINLSLMLFDNFKEWKKEELVSYMKIDTLAINEDDIRMKIKNRFNKNLSTYDHVSAISRQYLENVTTAILFDTKNPIDVDFEINELLDFIINETSIYLEIDEDMIENGIRKFIKLKKGNEKWKEKLLG